MRKSVRAPRPGGHGLWLRTVLFVVPILLLPAAGSTQEGLTAGGGFAAAIMSECRTDTRLLNQVSGWQVRWPGALETAPVGTPEERTALLEYWADGPAALEADVLALQEGLRAGTSAPRAVVRRVQDQLDGLLEIPRSESPLWSPAERSSDPEFRRVWDEYVRHELLPALRSYRAFLSGPYYAAAREDPGLGSTPGGAACYEGLIERWTSLELSPAEVEAIGRSHLESLQDELLSRASPQFGTTLPEVLEGLRAGGFADPFRTSEDVVRHAEAAVARAEDAVAEWVGSPSNVPIRVEPMPEFMESSFPAGLYQAAGPDGVARYIVNTSRPAERRLLSEPIAFHETIPGHHTHSTARAPGGAFVSGLAEGWAIYAEVLAQEMGLYSSDLDEIGRIAKHLWATSRLIVEPGLHVGGWSRPEAIRFMLENTALSRSEVELEVDRYLALPGQSLSYMLGNLHIRDLREQAETQLGSAFDVRAFHDVVLSRMRPLPEVSRDVGRWVARLAVSRGANSVRAFAPGILPRGRVYRGTFSHDGTEFYFFRGAEAEDDHYTIYRMQLADGGWSEPSAVDLGGDHSDLYPTLSPDGSKLVFISYRPFPGVAADRPQANLWEADRRPDGWSEPRPLIRVSHPDRYESHALIEPDGRLSFRRAGKDGRRETSMVAEPVAEGGWAEPIADKRIEVWRGWRGDLHIWGGIVHPSGELAVLDISAVDESGRRGRSDLWVTRRTEEGWSEPRPAPSAINTPEWDNFPVFTPDGEQLVFVRAFDRFLTAPVGVLTRETAAPQSADWTPTLAATAFMAGTWCSAPDDRGTVIEEHYTTPTSNLMLGVTRYVRAGRTIGHEFSRLEADTAGVVLTAMPSSQQETDFALVEASPGRVVFENPDHDFPVRVIYHRADGDLVARIEGRDGAGPEWRMARCPGGAPQQRAPRTDG